MTPAEMPPIDDETVAEAAAGWFARAQAGRLSKLDEDGFHCWRTSDRSHQQAYDEVEAAWGLVEQVRLDPSVLRLREHARGMRRTRRLAMAGRLAAACLVVAVGAGLVWTQLRSAETSTIHTTKTGETSTLTLADGSKVLLDTDSTVKVWSRRTGERRLELLRGRAFFEVAKNKERPFVVRVGGGSITALGTAFAVRVQPNGMKVVLVEGKVKVLPVVARADTKPLTMVAGQKVVNEGASLKLSAADAEMETSWLHGTLVFVEQPLGQVVAELNRYSDRKIEITDPAIGRKPVSAVLKTSDAATFLKAVESMKLGSVREVDGGKIIIDAP